MEYNFRLMINKKVKLLAFTLAEVLLTLGIIGVVAAYTIPTLMRNTQDAEFKAGFKKSFADLAQVLNRYNHEVGNSFIMEDGSIEPTFWTYFKTAKICTDAITEGCWPSTYYTLNGGTTQLLGKTSISMKDGAILNNGVLLGVRRLATGTRNVGVTGNPTISDCGASENAFLPDYIAPYDTGNKILYLFDINGFKGPNRVGKDIYMAYSVDTIFLKAPQVAQTSSSTEYYESCKCYGSSCSYAAIMGGN